jgi:hypothetical protein
LRYANDETPLTGDRIKNSSGGLGKVTAVSPGSSARSEPTRITVKWDEGIIEIDYDQASRFTLVSRAPGATGNRHGTAGHS